MNELNLDQPEILSALFHPRPEYLSKLPHSNVHRVKIEVEPTIFIGGRLYIATPTAPVILYFHGNGEIAADYDSLFPLYTERGITLLVMDYRGYGTSNGHPTVTNLIADANVIFAHIKQIWTLYELTPPKLYLMGRSLGSAPAIEIAAHVTQDEVSGLIIESGFANTLLLLNHLGVSVDGQLPVQFSNVAKIRRVTLPLLVIHGQDDLLIPASEAEELYQRAGSRKKQLLLIPNAGHNDLLIQGLSRYFAAIEDMIIT